MKLPRWTAAHALCRGGRGVFPAVGHLVPASPAYQLSFCTADLYETDRSPGHPRLKHCFVRIEGSDGEAEHWGYGRAGLGPEPYPDTPSRQCWALPENLDAGQKAAFLAALAERAGRGYAWGKNDCCSVLLAAQRDTLGREAPPPITEAAQELGGSPEIWPSGGRGAR